MPRHATFHVSSIRHVRFENMSCFLPVQEHQSLYKTLLTESLQRDCGVLQSVSEVPLTWKAHLELCDTKSNVSQDGSTDNRAGSTLTWGLDNLCGSFFMHVDKLNSMIRTKCCRKSTKRHFYGKNLVLHSSVGRFTIELQKNRWTFKGVRDIEAMKQFIAEITQSTHSSKSVAGKNVNSIREPEMNDLRLRMCSMSLRYVWPITISGSNSILWALIQREYIPACVKTHIRCDDTNNLHFIDIQSFEVVLRKLLSSAPECVEGTWLHLEAYELSFLRAQLNRLQERVECGDEEPKCSVGVTRFGNFFVRINFQEPVKSFLEMERFSLITTLFIERLLWQIGCRGYRKLPRERFVPWCKVEET